MCAHICVHDCVCVREYMCVCSCLTCVVACYCYTSRLWILVCTTREAISFLLSLGLHKYFPFVIYIFIYIMWFVDTVFGTFPNDWYVEVVE